jgi:hypothetical protein
MAQLRGQVAQAARNILKNNDPNIANTITTISIANTNDPTLTAILKP